LAGRGQGHRPQPGLRGHAAYGYGQATREGAEGLADALGLPDGARAALRKAPRRLAARPWPPTDPFVYRLYEVVMLCGPVFKDVATSCSATAS